MSLRERTTVEASAVDFSRHTGLLDHAFLSTCHVGCIGVGGAAGLVTNLARSGIASFTLIDPDHVSATNPATQQHDLTDLGRTKVEALRDRLLRLNPAVHITTHTTSYERLEERERTSLWQADLVLAMTDRFATQARINRDALSARTDTLFANVNIGATGFDITGTLPPDLGQGIGCHRCHALARYRAYENGFVNPTEIGSNPILAELANSLLGMMTLSLLHHRQRSALPIVRIAEAFIDAPCAILSVEPSFLSSATSSPSPNRVVTAPFAFRLYPLDTPRGFTCPDCGTKGVLETAPRTPTSTRKEDAPCSDPSSPAAYAREA